MTTTAPYPYLAKPDLVGVGHLVRVPLPFPHLDQPYWGGGGGGVGSPGSGTPQLPQPGSDLARGRD